MALGSGQIGLIAGSSRDRRGDRFVLLAILLSLVVHLILALLWVLWAPRLAKLLPVPAPVPTEQFVTVSSAVRIEHRAKPVPQDRAPAPAPRAARRPEPRPQPVAEPVRARRELSAVKPLARPAPPESTRRPATPPPRKVALAERRQIEVPKQAPLSAEKVAQLDKEFEKTIAQARAASNPLSVANAQASATKRYPTQMVGIEGRIVGFQGLCDPIKSWAEDGWNYYYVACNVAFDDGRVERQGVPWPVRFRPQADPFAGTGGRNVPLAPPLPGWEPGPNDVIAPELRRYFHDRGVDI